VFTKGMTYTRREIHLEVGGDLVSYLPSLGGRVVAACLRPDTDPDAPRVILPGSGPGIERSARRFVSQGSAVPTFLRLGPHRLQYVGRFAADRWSHDAAEIGAQHRRSKRSEVGRDRITSVIHTVERSE